MLRLRSAVGALLLTMALAGGAAAQEAEPATAPEGEAAAADADASVELPVAEYWGEWALHTEAALARLQNANTNATKAKSKQAGFYRDLLGVHQDELRWLENHRPEDCYATDYEEWRAANERLRAGARDAVASARKGDAKGLKKAAKQRNAAIKDLNGVMGAVADCVDSTEPASEPGAPIGKWLAKPVWVEDDGFVDKSPRKLSISEGGNLLLRIARHPFCRDAGLGLVPMTIKGSGWLQTEGRPGFVWTLDRLECKEKGKGQKKLAGPGEIETLISYDEANDVLIMGPECYWRVKGGDRGDCNAFWRGTPPAAAIAATPAETATEVSSE